VRPDTLTICDNAPNLDEPWSTAFEAKSRSGYDLSGQRLISAGRLGPEFSETEDNLFWQRLDNPLARAAFIVGRSRASNGPRSAYL
jgi:hypothetical protein